MANVRRQQLYNVLSSTRKLPDIFVRV